MEPPNTPVLTDANRVIADTLLRETSKLTAFIKARVSNTADAEDVLQDVFYEFTQAYRLPEPIEQVSNWLFRVARNRLIDRFRKKERVSFDEPYLEIEIPSLAGDPEAELTRLNILAALQQALQELPVKQREIFVAHEIDGLSFETVSRRDGIPVNTLLSQKRSAVLYLRKRLQVFYDELGL